MADPEQLAVLKKGAIRWNQSMGRGLDKAREHFGAHYRRSISEEKPSRADLTGADLREADLHGAYPSCVDFSEADLSGARFCRAHLDGAYLSMTDLTHADLRGASLTRADLIYADLTGATLDLMDVEWATVGYTTFDGVNLSRVKGLGKLAHCGPSHVDINTIYKSKGEIPHAFLRGAGIPDNFIDYMAYLTGTGIEFYSLFISYSPQDEDFAQRLPADLQDKGIRCWFAPHDMRRGKKVHEQIEIGR